MNHQNENGFVNPNENGNANPNQPQHPLAIAIVENAVDLHELLVILFANWTIIHDLPLIQDYVVAITNFALGTNFHGQNVHFDGVYITIPGNANAAVGNGGVADGGNVGGVAGAVIEGAVGNGGVAAVVIEGGVADGGNGGGLAAAVIEGGGGGVNDELG